MARGTRRKDHRSTKQTENVNEADRYQNEGDKVHRRHHRPDTVETDKKCLSPAKKLKRMQTESNKGPVFNKLEKGKVDSKYFRASKGEKDSSCELREVNDSPADDDFEHVFEKSLKKAPTRKRKNRDTQPKSDKSTKKQETNFLLNEECSLDCVSPTNTSLKGTQAEVDMLLCDGKLVDINALQLNQLPEFTQEVSRTRMVDSDEDSDWEEVTGRWYYA